MSGEIFNMPLKHLGHSDAKEKRKSKRKRNNKKSKKLPGDYQSDYLYLEEQYQDTSKSIRNFHFVESVNCNKIYYGEA